MKETQTLIRSYAVHVQMQLDNRLIDFSGYFNQDRLFKYAVSVDRIFFSNN